MDLFLLVYEHFDFDDNLLMNENRPGWPGLSVFEWESRFFIVRIFLSMLMFFTKWNPFFSSINALLWFVDFELFRSDLNFDVESDMIIWDKIPP